MADITKKIDRSDVLEYIKEIKDELVKDGIYKIALFGSYARNEVDIYSDIDIAIKLQSDYLEKRNSWDYFDLIAKIKTLITQKFHVGCDIFDLDSDSFIKKSVMKDLIYV